MSNTVAHPGFLHALSGAVACALPWVAGFALLIVRKKTVAQAEPAPAIQIDPVVAERQAEASGSIEESHLMSDLSALIRGKMSPSAFVAKESAAIKANPIFAFLEPLALDATRIYLATKIGPTAASLIVTDIETVLSGDPASLTGQAEAAVVALIQGAITGQSGSKTGQQVLSAVVSASSGGQVSGGGTASVTSGGTAS